MDWIQGALTVWRPAPLHPSRLVLTFEDHPRLGRIERFLPSPTESFNPVAVIACSRQVYLITNGTLLSGGDLVWCRDGQKTEEHQGTG